ncbi:MAG: PQQ-binding-like beta-propeller repeat protein [Planctomycetes bacterium]|nr:PQQ-binding-like beta-propeller repeat protein [Planctomycetota bacterium]
MTCSRPKPFLLATSFVLLLVGAGIQGRGARAEDWPTYQHDFRRSAATKEKLDVKKLQAHWAWRSDSPPQPAWFGPAKWDAYAGIKGLRSMRNYDPAFHIISVGQNVYFGSSADDSVYCLDAKTGQRRWRFTTDGPVRVAPTYYDGKLYFGSDDGNAYCLDATTGKQIWSYRPVPQKRMILHNGRFIPFLPCRTGVVVENGTAQFGFSMLPWKESYLVSVDAKTGKPEGKGRFVQKIAGLTMEGPLAASPYQLIAPQGRVAPKLFARADGKSLGSLSGGGGSFVILTPDDTVLHGPGNKTGWITGSNSKTRAKIASYPGGNAMIVAGEMSYLLTDNELRASNWVKRKHVWQSPAAYPYALILAGDVLFAGGEDEVAAISVADGKILWKHQVDGNAYALAAAGGRLLVSTDEGAVYCFAAGAPQTKPQGVASVHTQSAVASTPPKAGEPTKKVTPLRPIAPLKDDALLGRWVFQKPHLSGQTVKNLAGGLAANISGNVRTARVAAHEALVLDGKSSVLIQADHTKAKLPKTEITAEAWVRVDQPLPWGGILGAFQDNGDYERGWLLGYVNARFSFGISSKQGNGKLTYLQAPADFDSGRWYHVAGSYDGQTMRLYVDGKEVATSGDQQGEINYPPKAFFEIGAYHDNDENFRLKGQLHEVRLYGRALSAKEITAHVAAKQLSAPQIETVQLALGPWLQFTDPQTAVVRWQTAKPSPTILNFSGAGPTQLIKDARAKTQHEAIITGLRHNRIGSYTVTQVVDGKTGTTVSFEVDTFFNYNAPPAPGRPGVFPVDAAAKRIAVHAIYLAAKTKGGLCLVLGSDDGQLAYRIAQLSGLRVIGFETDKTKVAASREALHKAGVYGSRVSIHHVDSLDKLPIAGQCANLIVSQQMLAGGDPVGNAAEVMRLLRPGAGIAVLGQPEKAKTTDKLKAWLGPLAAKAKLSSDAAGTWARLSRPPLTGAGSWTHLYGEADNSGFAGETLAGATNTGDLEIQWLGRPGPRYQVDRNGRKPSPLSTGGRLFMQGNHRIVALDAFNGVVLWSLELPEFHRFNMPRDCSNWCADEQHIYAAVRDKLWRIDVQTGQVSKMFDVLPAGNKDWKYDWGYLASRGNKIIGSAVKQGASFTNFWGGGNAGWYDAQSGPITHKVCSDNLFALDKRTGKVIWSYRGGVVVNSTITAGSGKIYFIESRNNKVRDGDARRLGSAEFWQEQFLVAIDENTGKKLWERSIQIPDTPLVSYLAHANNKLVLVTSGAKKYRVDTFADADGTPGWKTEFGWPGGKGDHGTHMSRPTIVENSLYVRPSSFDLKTGKMLAARMPGGGCGTYCATTNALFFRSGTINMWNRKGGKSTTWDRLRPDCWLSMIPAAGMLLAPEGGGGCSCGNWMETSIGFIPIALDRGR